MMSNQTSQRKSWKMLSPHNRCLAFAMGALEGEACLDHHVPYDSVAVGPAHLLDHDVPYHSVAVGPAHLLDH